MSSLNQQGFQIAQLVTCLPFYYYLFFAFSGNSLFCWISDSTAKAVAVVTPVCLALAFNAVCLTKSLYGIHRLRHWTRDRDFGPAPRHWTRDRDIGPATATLDPRPRLWTRDPRPATISQTPINCPDLDSLIGQYASCLSNWTVRAITRALKWLFFFTASQTKFRISCVLI